MAPYALVVDGEMYVTYAASEDAARAAFVDELGADENARVKRQPARAPEDFKYTIDGAPSVAMLVGERPVEYRRTATAQPAEREDA